MAVFSCCLSLGINKGYQCVFKCTHRRLINMLHKYIYIHWEFAKIEARKNENPFFHEYFLNIDISLNIP